MAALKQKRKKIKNPFELGLSRVSNELKSTVTLAYTKRDHLTKDHSQYTNLFETKIFVLNTVHT